MAVNTRWDQKTYRRHMFNRGRGVRSPHDASNTRMGTSQFVDSQLGQGHWWEASWRSPWAVKLNAAKEYEQYNNPDSAGLSLFTLDSTERERFRKQDRKEVRDLFQKQLSEHHFSKHKKLSRGQLDKIVDAYMSQDDDKFQATLAGMGFSDKDAGRVRRAAEESATAAIEGTAYGTKWDDDDYAKQTGANSGAGSESGSAGQAGSVGPAKQGGTVSNGRQKVPQPGTVQGQSPALTPRKAGPDTNIGSTPSRWNKNANRSSGVTVDGAPVYNTDSATNANIRRANDAKTNVAAMQAEDQEQLQRAASANTPSEAYQVRQNERERIEQMGKDRRARQAAEREAAARRRADKRFADRTLYNEADWKNLGREGSNKADYSDRREGESDKDWAVRDKARQERQGRMDALLKRLDDMGVQDAEKNSFYANDPNKQQNLARLRGLIVGDDGKVRGDITDAQIEGANATLDAWKKGADEKGARQKAFKDMKQAEEVSQLRQKYGLNYGDFTAGQVLDYHQRHQMAERKRILSRMQVAPGLTPELEKLSAHTDLPGGDGRTPVISYSVEHKDMRPAAMAKYAQDWQALLDTGFNPTTTFQELMKDDDMRKSFDSAVDAIPRNDPDWADKRDQLRRRMIIQKAMGDAGLKGVDGDEGKPGHRIGYVPLGTGEQLAADPELNARDNVEFGKAMAQNLPGKAVLAPIRGAAEAVADALHPKQPQQTPGVQVFHSAADAMKARDMANAAAGLKPRQQTRLRPGGKREETMAW